MSLNLNSLKSLSVAPAHTEEIESPPLTPMDSVHQGATPETFQNAIPAPQGSSDGPVLTTGPKISLLKLKKASGISTQAAPAELIAQPLISAQDISSSENKEPEKGPRLSLDRTQTPLKNEDIASASKEEINTLPSFAKIALTEAAQNPKEAQSIILDNGTEALEDTNQENTETVAVKELFPNFRISDSMNLGEDLLDLQDTITITEHREPTILAEDLSTVWDEASPLSTEVTTLEESSADNTGDLLTEEIMEAPEVTDTPAQESAYEAVSATIVHEELPNGKNILTPEYVAEVKTELSEGRRAGFRFFTQRKTKIIAGISLVALSISAITLLSGTFLSNSMQKTGKGNVQETMQSEVSDPEKTEAPVVEPTMEPVVEPADTAIVPETASWEQTETDSGTAAIAPATAPVTAPVVTAENTDYEAGVDYSVTKNTKKNIRHDASSGAEIPTPQKDLAK